VLRNDISKVITVFDVVVDIHKAYNPLYIMLNMCLCLLRVKVLSKNDLMNCASFWHRSVLCPPVDRDYREANSDVATLL